MHKCPPITVREQIKQERKCNLVVPFFFVVVDKEINKKKTGRDIFDVWEVCLVDLSQ